MTKQESINKYLVENVEGGCWWRCNCGSDNHSQFCLINDNPDFSKPENFIRLLKIAERKEVVIDFNTFDKRLTTMVDFKSFKIPTKFNNKLYIDASDIPSTLSELLAKSLGWKEVE